MIKRFNRHKYGAVRSKCLSGHNHRSKLEAKCCNRLLADLQDGKIKSYETEVRFSLSSCDDHICNYYADFLVTHLDGSLEIVEAKGMCTQVFVLKWKLMQSQYPKLKFTIVKK